MMKLFTKNTFRNLAVIALGATVLSACGGVGSCIASITSSGNLTLSIAAPSQYPAGLPTPINASLTMTNTSDVNASNLVYSIPAPNDSGNYTGVIITPNAGVGSVSGDCTNIAAHQSCTFTATIAAYANPGSFTVTATPGSTSALAKIFQSGKALQASSISVMANLGLVDIPNTNNEYYILPSDQTIQGSTSHETTVLVSILVKAASAGLDKITLVDETGALLSYAPVGTVNYSVDSVNSYAVTIPAGRSIQHIQAFGYNGTTPVCDTLNIGSNNNTACSNNAQVNLAQSGVGILAIQPNYFQMTESRESQVITLQNIGTAEITALRMPSIDAPFSILANNCSTPTALKPLASCMVTIGYTAGSSSGQGSYVVSYNNGVNVVNTTATIPYVGVVPANYAVLTLSPTSFSLSESHPVQRITLTNTGTTDATGLTLPTLSLPLTESGTTTCLSSVLAIGSSCYYDLYINYGQTQVAGTESVVFTYYNGQQTQTARAAADWSSYTFKFWTLISGGDGQPEVIGEVYGSPTPQNIVVSGIDTTDFSSYLWTYVNGIWTQLCNGQDGTPSSGRVLGAATTSSILWQTDSGELWAYQGGTWTKLLDSSATENAPAGSSFGGLAENSTPTTIVGTDFSSYQLWMYNNNVWTKLTGGASQPANSYMLSKGGAEPTAITSYDNAGDIWFYNGYIWSKIGVAAANNPPNPNASTTGGTFYGASTANSVIYTASLPNYTASLWIYDGSNWLQNGTVDQTGTPVDVGTIFGTPSNSNLITHLTHECFKM